MAEKIVLNLALQGGGSHGAYTWGVLDYLLDQEHVHIEGISGTSAGAMNAAIYANGLVMGGREGAKKKLAEFWREVAEAARYANGLLFAWDQIWAKSWNLDSSPIYQAFEAMKDFVAPYYPTTLRHNPLEKILNKVLDVDALRTCTLTKIFITATRVRDGQPRIFGCDEITVPALLASSCLPQLFPAVEIDGVAYWDGGYMGNPAIWPLIYHCKSPDILLVQLNPLVREETPRDYAEITNRLNEITFNSSLIAEMRAIYFVKKLLSQHKLDEDRYKDVLMHMVERPAEMDKLDASSKMNVSLDFFEYLRDLGRAAAAEWFKKNAGHIGQRSTIDIQDRFLTKVAHAPHKSEIKPLPKKLQA